MQDEQNALALCRTKVHAKKLPMEVVDAEYQCEAAVLLLLGTSLVCEDVLAFSAWMLSLANAQCSLVEAEEGGVAAVMTRPILEFMPLLPLARSLSFPHSFSPPLPPPSPSLPPPPLSLSSLACFSLTCFSGRNAASTDIRLHFKNVEKQFESYQGINIKLQCVPSPPPPPLRHPHVLQVLHTGIDITADGGRLEGARPRGALLPAPVDTNTTIKMEVGIEDCLHIEFEYNKSKYHLKNVIVGKIYFLLVRIKIKHMELSILWWEATGSPPNQCNESETITKFEVMNGVPVRGETISIRLFLGGFDLTLTVRDINKKFSTRITSTSFSSTRRTGGTSSSRCVPSFVLLQSTPTTLRFPHPLPHLIPPLPCLPPSRRLPLFRPLPPAC
ncbi:vacuolar protein sorting-associated protein 26-domain-containing protein [Mycena vulgaris]|nr:vacuolar protein sorting-associated protein 26-domain-containing protein [Mycena vulgaris]